MLEVGGIIEVVTILVQQYGITGLSFGALLLLLYKNKKDADKRISELEIQADANQTEQMTTYKDIIDDYVSLVKTNTEVLSKLTNCLESMNTALSRMERKKDE